MALMKLLGSISKASIYVAFRVGFQGNGGCYYFSFVASNIEVTRKTLQSTGSLGKCSLVNPGFLVT